MFWPILRFELRYHLKRPVTYLYFAIFFLLSFFTIASEAMELATGLVKRNSPYGMAQLVVMATAVGQVITTAVAGTALLRDFEHRSHELVFTTRVTRLGYLGGRFGGALAAMLVAFMGIPLGALAGSIMPWVDAERLLPIDPWFYFQPFLLFGVTNVIIVSALFFAVGAFTRSLFAIYTQGIFLLVAWSVSQEWLTGVDRHALANVLDIFGFNTVDLTTRYWTVAERNSLTLPLEGYVLTNRLVWLGVAAALLLASALHFRFEAQPRKLFRMPARWRRATPAEPAPAGPAAIGLGPTGPAQPVRRPTVTPAFAGAALWRQVTSSARFSFLRIVRDKPFVAIAAIGAVNVFMSAWYVDELYGVTTLPVTYLVANMVGGAFFLFMVILTTIYAGESVWRERGLGADQIVDALPVPTWTPAVGKVVGLALTQLLLLLLLNVVGMAVQLIKGYTEFQPLVYLQFTFGTQLPWVVAVTLFAFLVHALVDNKFMGHAVIILWWIGTVVAFELGFEHQLFNPGFAPGFIYSAMNGFGHFTANLALSAGYALGLGLMAITVGVLFWARGTDTRLRQRTRQARARWSPRALAVGASGLAMVLLFGGAIFYNTNVLNRYVTSDDGYAELAAWERTYRRYIHLRPPRITAVDVRVDLWPERRAYALDGTYVVVNREAAPLDSILLNFDDALTVERMEWSVPARAAIQDTVTGTQLWVLEAPMAPGDSMELRYRMAWAANGFPNSGSNTRVVENGTFLPSLGPSLGYNTATELSNPDERRKQGLSERERLPDLDDPDARRNPQFAIDSDLVDFSATVSTAPDQIALAPGTLVREWEEGGRRLFRYEMERPIANFATVASARYEVVRDRWKDVDISVYHHPGHDYNVARMIAAVKASLDYYTEHFSPYQYSEIRILEFPRYANFAQSFPTTIPYSEGIGFILKVSDKDDDLDMPFFVTAHEVAHQWWGHQVVGARAQGSAMMVESMAEYAALTVMEKKYGASHARKFLRHELDDYLTGRTGERIREQPLLRTENQGYIHYNKGSLALYAIRDYIGEEAMNRALRGYLQAHAFEGAPYSTARDFVGYLRAETPDSLQYVITDLIETITLWDNKASEATVTSRADGGHTVRLVVESRKVRADSLGNETEVPLADYVDVGVFGEREPGNSLGRPLYLEKHRITGARTEIEIVVDEQPRRAGIDPYNKLIDRMPGDNVREVSSGG